MNKYLIFMLLSFYSFLTVAQDISGNWMGTVSIPSGDLDIAFNIAKEGGNYKSTMDIPAQSLKGAAAESTTLIDNILTMSFPNLHIEYKGSLNDKNELIGNLIQGPNAISLILNRGEIIHNRPQEPKPPFDYYSENITFKTADNLKLEGTLTLPKKHGKFPVAIIISGSGPQSRDGEIYDHKPYLVIGDFLTKNGIGVLRFDERGVGESEGDFNTATIKDFSSDINSAIGYLKNRDEIDSSKIGLIGHSIGGIVAPKVASGNNNIHYIVLLAGPGIDGDKLMMMQKAAYERALGYNEIQIKQSQEVVKGSYDIIINSDLDNIKLKDSINSFYQNKYGKSMPENLRNTLVKQVTASEYISLIRSKPSIYLSKVTCPVLALNGSKDLQVPSKENLDAIKKALEENGNKNVKIVELENLNHLFQECKTGLDSEYNKIEQTIAPKVLEIMTQWIKKQTE